MKSAIAIFTILIFASAHSQTIPRIYRLSAGLSEGQPSSNVVSQILVNKGNVYLATNKGLNITSNGGLTFQKVWGINGPTGVSVGAVAIKGDTIAVAADSADLDVGGSFLPVGGGLYVSTDNGATWTYETQSKDSLIDTTVTFGRNTLRALPITTHVQNITFSLVFHKGYLYTANFGGGLRRSSDLGKTWERVVLPPDNLNYITQDSTYTFQLSPQSGKITTEANLNHEAFSLYSDGDSVLYVGTADGINKTTDNGYSWTKFNHQNEASPISGNFVVSLAGQDYGGVHAIWGATVLAADPTEVSALSYTTDNGATWTSIFRGHFFHAIAFQGKIVYGVSDDGLFRTPDLGNSSEVITQILDQNSGGSILSQTMYAVAANGDSIWVSGDGTAVGVDDGSGFNPDRWHIFRAYVSVAATNSTYFYPNPFSPRLDVGRIHYNVKGNGSTVTIRIFDFSMHVIRTLLQNAPRNPGETDEQWNGMGDRGELVDNGVYFYSVVVGSDNPIWGKILVIR